MNKFLILAVAAIVATCTLTGCIGEVETYTDSGQTISIGVNRQFVIALGSNPTTGYMWQESFDETMLELVEKIYKQGSESEQGTVGAGGVEYFRFKTLKAGQAEIVLVYKRPWEELTPEDVTRVFTINIK